VESDERGRIVSDIIIIISIATRRIIRKRIDIKLKDVEYNKDTEYWTDGVHTSAKLRMHKVGTRCLRRAGNADCDRICHGA
jgi:hypothetical protein